MNTQNVMRALDGTLFPLLNKESNVFFYLGYNGSPGVISFPNNELLFVDQFKNALNHLDHQKLFAKLIIYMDGPGAGAFLD